MRSILRLHQRAKKGCAREQAQVCRTRKRKGDKIVTSVFGDSRLKATLYQKKDHFEIELMDAASGRVWGRSPLLMLEIYAKAEFRVEPVRTYAIHAVEKADDGLHLSIGDDSRQIRVGLWLRIRNGELSVTMPMPEVYEDKSVTHRLFSVVLLPGLMKANHGGKMLLPLNSGILCNPAGKPKLADRFMIYGEQDRWELLPMLPIAAVQTPTGGLMVLARRGAEETECHVATDGKGGGEISFGLSLRQHWPDPVEFATREVVYIPVPRAADIVHFPAKRLRRHVMDDLGKGTIRQRAEESPEVRSLLQSYIMKLFYAVENKGIMMHGVSKGDPVTFKFCMNFGEAKANLQKLHAAGVEKIHTQSVGWNPSGHDGLWPTRFPIDDRLGGEAAFRDLLAAGRQLGYTMNVHDNQLSAYTRSPDFNPENVCHDQWGQPMGLGEWGGGITYILNALARSEAEIEGSMRGLQALGLNGAGYLDGMGNPLYRDYHPRHRMTRTDYARGTNRLIDIARRVYGAAGTECGFLYCTIPADSITTMGSEWHMKGCWPEWPATALMDQRVPCWALALHDLVIVEGVHGLNWPSLMEGVLFGLHPRDEWSAHPGVMPVLDDARICRLKAVYDLSLVKFGHLQTEELLRYEEPEPGVRTSAFADGTEVIADFRKGRLVVNGKNVPRPKGL